MKTNNILFFTCFNFRSIQIESSIYYFQKNGYTVSLLTTCEKGPLHFALEKNGINTQQMDSGKSARIFYYFRLIRTLTRYSKKNNIHFIHSHLQIPNLVSCIARFFMQSTVFNVRHHSDVVFLSGTYKERLIDKIVNKLSDNIIAISDKVKNHLIEKEHVNREKIHRINNGYDFIQYETLSKGPGSAIQIKEQYPAELLIASPARLVGTKRHPITIEAVEVLQKKGLNVKLLILGDGPEKEALDKMIIEKQLSEFVFLTGYLENISDYIKAADVVALLSESEASNNVIKEAGYFEKIVITCKDVGDFSDYIENKRNGYLLQKEHLMEEFVTVLEDIYHHKNVTEQLGKNLKQIILKKFDMEVVGKKYEELQNKINR